MIYKTIAISILGILLLSSCSIKTLEVSYVTNALPYKTGEIILEGKRFIYSDEKEKANFYREASSGLIDLKASARDFLYLSHLSNMDSKYIEQKRFDFIAKAQNLAPILYALNEKKVIQDFQEIYKSVVGNEFKPDVKEQVYLHQAKK